MIDMERFPERNIRLERFGMHDLSDSGQVVTCGLVITKKCLRWCATSSKVHGGKDREIQLNPPWQTTIDQKLPNLRCGLRLRLVNAEASRRNLSVVCCQTGVLVRCSAMSVDSTAGVSRATCLNGGGRRYCLYASGVERSFRGTILWAAHVHGRKGPFARSMPF